MASTETEKKRNKINLETSKMPWHELQRFFANGSAVYIAPELDLVEVAYQFSQDNKKQIKQWMSVNKLALVSDIQATKWVESDEMLWAVVIKPWILVQNVKVNDE